MNTSRTIEQKLFLPSGAKYPSDTTLDITENNYLKHNPIEGYVHATIGNYRKSMEDNRCAYYRDNIRMYAVFDGHGGHQTSHASAGALCDYIYVYLEGMNFDDTEDVKKYIKMAVVDYDRDLMEYNYHHLRRDGSTMTMVIIINNKYLYVVNLGDSRTVFVENGAPIYESNDHKPYNLSERERINSLGGGVSHGRVNGRLALSRALGDFDYKVKDEFYLGKNAMVSCEPDVELLSNTSGTFVLASDGLWDVITSHEAARVVATREKSDRAKTLIDLAIDRGSSDNITVMVIDNNA